MEKNKSNKIIVIICGLIILFIYFLELKNDYFFIYTKESTYASINKLTKKNRSYLVEINYYNKNLHEFINCYVKVDSSVGRELEKSSQNKILIIYTKQNSCQIYVVENKTPNLGTFIFHSLIFLTVFCGIIFLIIKFNN